MELLKRFINLIVLSFLVYLVAITSILLMNSNLQWVLYAFVFFLNALAVLGFISRAGLGFAIVIGGLLFIVSLLAMTSDVFLLLYTLFISYLVFDLIKLRFETRLNRMVDQKRPWFYIYNTLISLFGWNWILYLLGLIFRREMERIDIPKKKIEEN
jgi:hypothetical protein